MKVPRGTKAVATIPLVSTADVAFLLLIFFIVLAKNTNESAIDWKPASAGIEMLDAKNILCTVIIDKKNETFVNGMPCPLSALKTNVAAYLGDRPTGQRTVLLKVDKEVPQRIFTEAMLQIGAASGDVFRALDAEEVAASRQK